MYIDPPKRFLFKPRSINKIVLSKQSVSNTGVAASLTSLMGAKAEIFKERGDTTSLFLLDSRQAVFIDKESLPTGILIPS